MGYLSWFAMALSRMYLPSASRSSTSCWNISIGMAWPLWMAFMPMYSTNALIRGTLYLLPVPMASACGSRSFWGSSDRKFAGCLMLR